MTYPPEGGQPPYGQDQTSASPYGQQSYPPPYGAPQPQRPMKVTPSWVNLVTVGIVVAALVAVVLIFTLGSDDNTPVAGTSDSGQVTSAGSANGGSAGTGSAQAGGGSGDGGSSASAEAGGKPSEAAVKAGIIKILTSAAGASFTEQQISDIADCATPKLMAEMSDQTLQNYAAGKDVAATVAENDKAQEISSSCATEVVS